MKSTEHFKSFAAERSVERRALRRLKKLAVGALVFATFATTASMMPSATEPASAQSGSRLCGYLIETYRTVEVPSPTYGRPPTSVRKKFANGYFIEIPKGSSAVQKGICSAAQKSIRNSDVHLPNSRRSIRRAECEDVAQIIGYDGDPCLRMHRADTAVQARLRSITQIGAWGLRHWNGRGWEGIFFD